MSYQAWEDLLEDGDEPAAGAPIPSQLASAGGGIDADAVLREVPALADLMRQRTTLEQRMASLLGGGAAAPGSDAAREKLRLGGPPSTATERAAARMNEARDAARREAARAKAAERRVADEAETLRRQSLIDRGRQRLLAQQERLEEAARRRVQHGLEQAEQRYLPKRGVDGLRRDAADAIDRAREPLRQWQGQREQIDTQLRDALDKAKNDPKLQEALRDDPTALDGLDGIGDDLDEALALPDAWVEKADARAQQWSDRLRSGVTWGDRDRRLSVEGVRDGLERLDRLRQARRQNERRTRREDEDEARKKDQRAESRRDARRRERRRDRDDSSTDARDRRREQASSTD